MNKLLLLLIPIIWFVGCMDRIETPYEHIDINNQRNSNLSIFQTVSQNITSNFITDHPEYNTSVDAIGLWVSGASRATAYHVGDGIVVTAGHVVEAPQERWSSHTCPQGAIIRWGERSDSPSQFTSRCVEILAAQWEDTNNPGVDYAIIKVDRAPPAIIFPQLNAVAEEGQRITIMGYSSGADLVWSGHCKIFKTSSAGLLKPGIFFYSCNTESGNSGSPVITMNSKAVAVHASTVHTTRTYTDGKVKEYTDHCSTSLSKTPLAEYIKTCDMSKLRECVKKDGANCLANKKHENLYCSQGLVHKSICATGQLQECILDGFSSPESCVSDFCDHSNA